MSEYQYYEFAALDRPLTPQQQAELRERSSRARIQGNCTTVSVRNGSLVSH